MVMPQPKDQRPGRLDQVSTTKAHEHEETSKDGMGVLHPFQSQGKESSVESDEKKSTSKTSHSDVTFTVPTATSVGQSDFLNQLTQTTVLLHHVDVTTKAIMTAVLQTLSILHQTLETKQ
jgi:ribosome-interacting GTPase 1